MRNGSLYLPSPFRFDINPLATAARDGTLMAFPVLLRGLAVIHTSEGLVLPVQTTSVNCVCVCACVLMFVLNVVRWLRLKLPFNLTESIFISSVGSYY